MSPNTTLSDQPRVMSRRILDVLGCALCLIILTVATAWMLEGAGIGRAVYPSTTASASRNRDLNDLLRAIELNDVPAARRALRTQRFDVDTADNAGTPPINYALFARGSSATALLDLLIAAGADVNGRGTDGVATLPLLSAASLGRSDLVAQLLRAGAEVRGSFGNGWTALHFAAASGNPETVAVLLAAGADPEAEDDEGDTALAVAVKHECAATVALLAPSPP